MPDTPQTVPNGVVYELDWLFFKGCFPVDRILLVEELEFCLFDLVDEGQSDKLNVQWRGMSYTESKLHIPIGKFMPVIIRVTLKVKTNWSEYVHFSVRHRDEGIFSIDEIDRLCGSGCMEKHFEPILFS